MSRTTSRDARVGLLLVAAIAGVVGLIVVAAGGPTYLASHHAQIDVYFRDGQGVRVGCPVRIAGIDAGRVAAVDIAEHDDALRARVRIAVADDIAARLKQDAVIVISAGLTGTASVNIASVGESGVAWVPGQPIEGVESSLFDPILEEIGLGPVERDHLAHTIAEVRGLVDDVSPRARKILASLQQASDDVQQATGAAGPAVEEASGKVTEMVAKLDELLARADGLVAEIDATVAENREGIGETVQNVRLATARAQVLLQQYAPKFGELIEHLDQTRLRADRVLYQADVALTSVAGIVTTNRPEIERTIANVRDISDFGRMTVQKIYSNPLTISPLYKPGREAEAAMAQYDTAQVLLKAASEYNDAVKRMEALRGQMANPGRDQQIDAELKRAAQINAQIDPLMRQMAVGVQAQPDRGRPSLLPGNRGPGQ